MVNQQKQIREFAFSYFRKEFRWSCHPSCMFKVSREDPRSYSIKYIHIHQRCSTQPLSFRFKAFSPYNIALGPDNKVEIDRPDKKYKGPNFICKICQGLTHSNFPDELALLEMRKSKIIIRN